MNRNESEANSTGRSYAANYEPDVLARGLEVVFCGLNPASSAVAARHNFSHPSNRFWPVLELAGFTQVRLQPQNEQRLLDYGCGITAVVQRASRRAREISAEEFRRARPEFEAKIRRFAPRSVAFLGKQAVSIMMGQTDIAWGCHPERLAGALVWILPNPSGLNRSFTLSALVHAYKELRSALMSRSDA
jgi:double-stranded uracil-DNA glycosylase